MLSKLGQIDSAESTKYLTSAMKGYKVEVADTAGIVDKLTAVDMEAAVTAGGIAEAMSMTANGARLAGVDMNKLIGIMTATGEVSQAEMSRIGTAQKTMFARMSNVKLGKMEDDEGVDITTEINDVEKVLNKIGIPLRKSATEWNNFGDVLDKIGAKWNTLNGVQKSAIATGLGGVRQKEFMITLFENYDKALKYEKTALESSGTAIKKYEDAYLGGIEAKSAKLKASFESLSMSFIGSGLVGGITDAVRWTLEWVDGTNRLGTTAQRALVTFGAIFALVKRNAIASAVSGLAQYGSTIGAFGAGGVAGLQALTTATQGLSKARLMNVISTNSLNVSEASKLLIGNGVERQERIAILTKLGYIKTQNTQTISTTGAIAATKGLGLALKEATASMIAFLTTNPVGWVILAVGAIASLGWAFDKMTMSQEEAREALKKSFDEFTDADTNLESVNSKLSETQSRITELQNISNSGKITLVEESELEQLKLANSELEKQAIQLRQIRDEAQKTTNQDAINLYAKGSTSYTGYGKNGSEGWLKQNLKLLYNDWIPTSNFEVMGQDQYIDYATKSLEGLSSESENFKNIQSSLTPIMEDYRSISEKLVPTNESERKILEQVNLQLDKMTYGLGTASDKAKIFELAISKYGSSNTGLISVANASDITAEKFNELASSDLKKYFEDIGLSSDVAAKFLNALSNDALDAEENISALEISAKELKTSLDTLSETEGLLSSISKEIEESGNIGMSNITKMLDSYPELSTVLAEYLAGISSAQDVYEGLQEIYKTDYDNSVSLLTAKLETSEEYYTRLVESDNQYLKIMAENYGISLSDFKTLAEAKYAVEMKLLNALGFEWRKYYNIQSKTFTSTYVEAINSINAGAREKGLPYSSPEREQALAVQKALAQAAIDYGNITYGSVDFSTIGNSFKAGDKSGKENDANKEAFEAQKAIIDRQLALNLITEEQYINALESLYKSYFADRSKYLEEYTQYEIEVYNKRQSLLEQAQKDLESLHQATMDMIKQEMEEKKTALEKEKDNLKEAMEEREKALEKQKDNLKEYTDARKKALQDARDQDEYDKQVREKSKDIESIKAQLLGLSGDNSGAGMRKKTELNQALIDAQDELGQTVSDRQYDSQIDAIDSAYETQEKTFDAQIESINSVYEAQEKMLDSQIESIDSFLDNQGNLVQEAFNRMNGMSATLKSQLIAYNQEYGSGISNDIVKNWDSATEALMRYGSVANTYGTLTTITSSIGRPVGYATGTEGLKRDSIIVGTHELLLNKTGSNAYQMMNAGSPIFTEQQTNALKALLSSPSSLLTKSVGGVGLNSASTIMSMVNSNNSPSIEINYEMNINGTDPQGIKLALAKEMPKFSDYVLNKINKDVQFSKGVRLTAANMA